MDKMQLQTARSGAPFAAFNGVKLHSSYDPVKEAERFLARTSLAIRAALQCHRHESFRFRPKIIGLERPRVGPSQVQLEAVQLLADERGDLLELLGQRVMIGGVVVNIV